MTLTALVSRLLGRSEPTRPEPKLKDTSDGGLSKAELVFLGRFRVPQEPKWIEADPRWREVLGQDTAEAVRRFRERGLLVPGSPADLLSAGRSVKELKELCRAHGLKVSGTREELVPRLMQGIPDLIPGLIAGKAVLRCSPEAARLAEEEASQNDLKKAAAEEEVRAALAVRDFSRAARAMVQFEAGQVIPRGMGIDWTNYDAEAAALSVMFNRWPRLLAFVPEESRGDLRLAAGEMYLWALSRPNARSFVPELEGPLKGDVACRMLVAFALTEKLLTELRSIGQKRVVFIRKGGCAGCMSGPGIVPINSAPEIPRPECTNPEGCRCCLTAATREESRG